jgi:hypothetical protein
MNAEADPTGMGLFICGSNSYPAPTLALNLAALSITLQPPQVEACSGECPILNFAFFAEFMNRGMATPEIKA